MTSVWRRSCRTRRRSSGHSRVLSSDKPPDKCMQTLFLTHLPMLYHSDTTHCASCVSIHHAPPPLFCREEQDFEYAQVIQEELQRCAEEARRREQVDEASVCSLLFAHMARIYHLWMITWNSINIWSSFTALKKNLSWTAFLWMRRVGWNTLTLMLLPLVSPIYQSKHHPVSIQANSSWNLCQQCFVPNMEELFGEVCLN